MREPLRASWEETQAISTLSILRGAGRCEDDSQRGTACLPFPCSLFSLPWARLLLHPHLLLPDPGK